MPIQISQREYFTANEVCKHAKVSRQTLWRWRQGGKVPAGKRLRGKQLVFSRDELAMVEQYATHLEPAAPRRRVQMSLFDGLTDTRGA
jgi:hypothetical protein